MNSGLFVALLRPHSARPVMSLCPALACPSGTLADRKISEINNRFPFRKLPGTEVRLEIVLLFSIYYIVSSRNIEVTKSALSNFAFAENEPAYSKMISGRTTSQRSC